MIQLAETTEVVRGVKRTASTKCGTNILQRKVKRMPDWFNVAIAVIATIACSGVALMVLALGINTIRVLIEQIRGKE